MTSLDQTPLLSETRALHHPRNFSPFLHAPENARTIFIITLTACLPMLLTGTIYFGWRALVLAGISISSCVALESLYYRLSRSPAMLGRSHAVLTGMLLALTLPAWAPWYVPLVGAAFAVLVGKAIFGGVGHFLWQPALVGRLAVAVVFAGQLASPLSWAPEKQPLLARGNIVAGDITDAGNVEHYAGWLQTPPPTGRDALAITPPDRILAGLSKTPRPEYSALAYVPADMPAAPPAVLEQLPPIKDLFFGARPGGIGETCILAILVAGLFLIYRHYIKWYLPASFIIAAGAVAALAPIELVGPVGQAIQGWGPPGGWAGCLSGSPGQWPLLADLDQWRLPPLLREGLGVGSVYVTYQLISGEMILAAFFLATEMTSRPVTRPGQLLFGTGCGLIAMTFKLYLNIPIPAYMAVLIMNTLTPSIDHVMRPRVFGMSRLAWLRRM